MYWPLHWLHAVALVEAIAFLYFVEQRPRIAPRIVGLGHFCVETALVAGAFAASVMAMPPSDPEPVIPLILTVEALFVAGLALLAFGGVPLIIAWRIRRRRQQELGSAT